MSEECEVAQQALGDLIVKYNELVRALQFYADPQIYKPHPHGLAFDDRDLSFRARAALKACEEPPD